MRRSCSACIALLLLATPLSAQERPTVPPSDYGRWQTLGNAGLSPDGSWIAFEVLRVDEEVELRVRPVRGDTGRTILHARSAAFSPDSRWVAYLVGVGRAEEKIAERAQQPVRARLELMNLRTRAVVTIPAVSSFEFSGDGSHLAMRGYPPEGQSGRGFDLVVRDLASGRDTHFGSIAEYAWQDAGSRLAMVVDAQTSAGNGVRIFDAGTGVLRTLASDSSTWSGLAWRDTADDLAVLRATGDSVQGDDAPEIFAWTSLTTRAQSHRSASVEGSPAEARIMKARPLTWSQDGATVFFGLRDRDRADAAPAAVVDSTSVQDSVHVEVWHARDVDIIPEQKVRASRDRERSDLAAWHLDTNRLVRLGSDLLEEVALAERAPVALGLDGTPYERERMFGPVYRDLYVIDIRSGATEKVAERIEFQYGLSATGRYLLYLRNDHYYAYDRVTRRHANLTAPLPTSFIDADHDYTVKQKPPYGSGGWVADDRAVLLYDEYDIWAVRPDGSGGVRLTSGARERLRHRRMWLDPDRDRFVDPTRPFYVSLQGKRTKQQGYGRVRLEDDAARGGSAERLVLLDRSVTRLSRADSADVYLYRVEGFADSPDWFVAGPTLADAHQVSNTNPFMAGYAWGRAELIDYASVRGDSLQAALLYPANWRPGTLYPMIVHPYELSSGTIHAFSAPSERTPYNVSVLTQNGYFVLRPDVRYRGRDPGVSAVEALLPAVDRVLQAGMVDPDRIGLLGHSWGAYQTVFTATQTDRFAAAVAGAPLANLISMYLSIFWNTGGTDARIFEIQQGRMEVPPWADMDAYIRNSPLFSIERLDTPLLVAFGDRDGAVDWHQGIELYNAARRAGKELVMLVYEGENHSLGRKANQVDLHRRILQWFGHYLKGEPAPAWITSGVRYLDQQQ